MSKRILVLGVGNILFTDEGIGVRAVEYLQQTCSPPENVTFLDGGTLGMNLMNALMDCDLALIMDAVLGDGEPGAIYRLTGDDLRKSMSFHDSLHQTDLVDTLIYCDLLGHRPEAVVLGMEPQDYQTLNTELSPTARQHLPKLCAQALEELRQHGVVCCPKAAPKEE